MRCREAISLCTRVLLILLFFSYFLIKIPIFPIFSILSFLFSYFFEQPCCWTPCGISISIKMIASYLALFHELQYKKYKMLKKNFKTLLFMRLCSKNIECFHMTSRQPYWCPKTMKRRPCWCPKPILWEFNSFLMQTLSVVPINFT